MPAVPQGSGADAVSLLPFARFGRCVALLNQGYDQFSVI